VGLWKLRAWARVATVFTSTVIVAICVLLGIVSTVTARAFDSSALILTAVFGWPIYYFNLPKIKALFERPKA
jgi:hypothetical protein